MYATRPPGLNILLEGQRIRNLEEKLQNLEQDNDLMQRELAVNNSWIDNQQHLMDALQEVNRKSERQECIISELR